MKSFALTLKAQPAPLMLRPRSLVPTPPVEVAAASAEVQSLCKRAFDAERRAEQAQAAARASLAPHLAQVLKETVVQELATQRRELIKAQEEAAMEIAAMIRRLDSVQAPMQERLRSYETRIPDTGEGTYRAQRGKPRTAETQD
jgi:hypothetical protein